MVVQNNVDASDLKISIITPSFNQSRFLERTIISVINQDYKNVEYIIMDGGSTDGSVDIIKKYEGCIYHWESKSDKGQADAVFRGFEIATGDIIAWINSDDYYLEGVLSYIAHFFQQNPDIQWTIGDGIFVDDNDKILLKCYCPKINYERLLIFGMTFIQPTLFIRRDFFFQLGGFNRELQFSFDYDLVLRMSKIVPPGKINLMIAAFRHHKDSKTSTLLKINKIEDQYLKEKNHLNEKPKYYVYYKKILFGAELFVHRIHTSGIISYLIYKFKLY